MSTHPAPAAGEPAVPPDDAPVRWGMGDGVLGQVLALVVPTLVVGVVVGLTDRDDLSNIPLWGTALLQVPLWAGLLGAPLWATHRKGRRSLALDFGLRMRASDVIGVIMLILVVVIAAPVFEELFYRGLWLRAIERRAGTVPAVIGSSVLFGVVHFEPYDLPALIGFGVIAAVLTVRTGRLGPAIWAHVAFNLTAVVGLLAQ